MNRMSFQRKASGLSSRHFFSTFYGHRAFSAHSLSSLKWRGGYRLCLTFHLILTFPSLPVAFYYTKWTEETAHFCQLYFSSSLSVDNSSRDELTNWKKISKHNKSCWTNCLPRLWFLWAELRLVSLSLKYWHIWNPACVWGFSGSSDGKESACNVGDLG